MATTLTTMQHPPSGHRPQASEERKNQDAGIVGDADFIKMIRAFRAQNEGTEQAHANPGTQKVCITVRKRPINSKEVRKKDHDR